MKKIYQVAVRQFQMSLYGFRFVKMIAISEVINATDSLIQNIIRIASVDLSLIFLT